MQFLSCVVFSRYCITLKGKLHNWSNHVMIKCMDFVENESWWFVASVFQSRKTRIVTNSACDPVLWLVAPIKLFIPNSASVNLQSPCQPKNNQFLGVFGFDLVSKQDRHFWKYCFYGNLLRLFRSPIRFYL